MRAFVDTVETKEQAIAAMQAHYDAGRINNSDGRGCAVGCHYHAHDLERVHGIPRALARLEDTIFEGLSEAEAREWPLQYLRAINVGSDLSRVADKFILRILEDEDMGMISMDTNDLVTKAIELYRAKLALKKLKLEKWDAALATLEFSYVMASAVPASEWAMMLAHAASTVTTKEEHYAWMRDVLLSILKDTN